MAARKIERAAIALAYREGDAMVKVIRLPLIFGVFKKLKAMSAHPIADI